jgi:NAD(P)-dependent dehydrogenase (short-subunit alcohol dehydrogenase family)
MEEREMRIVVTGAKGALGSVVVEYFARQGATVVGLDLGEHSHGLLADPDRQDVLWGASDLTRVDDVRRCFQQIDERLGGFDALIHCAGGFRWTTMDEASDEDIDFLIDVNLRSSLYVVRQALQVMKRQGFGRIVLMSSRSTIKPGKGEGAYTATKAGLNALTLAVADEVKELDITINALQPVIIDTPANRLEMPDAPHERWVKREELAEIMGTLLGPKGAAINGALIAVSGKL